MRTTLLTIGETNNMKVSKKVLQRSSIGVAALAVMMLPVASYAASTTATTTINATVGSTISMTTSGTVAINLTPGGSAVVSSNSDNVSVSTNNATGYTLTLANNDSNRNLVSGANNIAAHAGTAATPTVLANNTWGYAVAGVPFSATYAAETNETSSTSLWAGVPASGSPVTLRTTAAPASGSATTVWYGVKVDSTQPTGTYTDTVTYTATTN